MTPSPLVPRRALAAFAALAAALAAFSAPTRFDIASQPAESALGLFRQQSKTQVTFNPEELKGVQSTAVVGEFEPAAALTTLLQNTGFTADERKPGWFVVKNGTDSRPGSIEGQVRDESGRPVPNARVTLAGSDMSVETDRRGRFTFEDVPAGLQTLGILAEGMQRTKVTDVVVRSNHRHTLGAITIPATVAGITQLEDYIVSARKNEGVVELDPYEVSGTREKPFASSNIDIQRTEDDVLPFTVFSAEEIQRSGAPDLAYFFRTRLSSNFTARIPEERIGLLTQGSASSAANELGLASGGGAQGLFGAKEVIILVNGRRLPNRVFGSASSFDSVTSGDYRGIPIASIDRIELISSASSVIYGAGATGAAINIITKKNYKGGALSVSYENPDDAHAPKRAIDFHYASPFAWGTQLRIEVSYKDTEPLTAGDRAYVIKRYRQRLQPTQLLNSAYFVGPLGGTTNIRSLSGQDLFGPGTAGYTSVPNGYTGGGGLTAFAGRQGVFNLELANGIGVAGQGFGVNTFLSPEERSVTMLIGFEKSWGSNWDTSLEYRYSKTVQTGDPAPILTVNTVAASAPSNPFGQPVRVTFYDPRLDPRSGLGRIKGQVREFKSPSDQVIVSTRGNVGEWRVLGDYSFNRIRDDYFAASFSPLTAGFGSSVLTEAIDAGIYNPFVDMYAVAPAPDSFYQDYNLATHRNSGATRANQLSLKGSGPLISLQSGVVTLTSGIEWVRTERYRGFSHIFRNVRASDGSQAVGGNNGGFYTPGLPTTVDEYSAYAESTVPLLKQNGRRWAFLTGDIFAAGRMSSQAVAGEQILGVQTVRGSDAVNRTQYQTVARKITTRPFVYAVGLRSEIFRGVELRVSESVGFAPPNFGRSVPSGPPTQNDTVQDRINNRQVILDRTQYITGGNPDLDPETTDSMNVGTSIRPWFMPRLRFALDYTENERDSAIASPSVQNLLDMESSDSRIAARIRRDASGNITFVDARAINFNLVSIKTMSFDLSYDVDNIAGGRVILSASATKILSQKVQTSVTVAPVEQLENASLGTVPSNWNANAQISWQREGFACGWAGRYLDDIVLPTFEVALQGESRIPAEFEHDVFASFRFARREGRGSLGSLLGDVTVSAGIKNVLNRKARFRAGNQELGYVTADSLYGRTLWLQVRKAL